MAGRRTRRKDSVLPVNSVLASAVRYPGKGPRVYSMPKEWQKEAYRHYGICGEARYAANYFGNSLSRATLYAANSLKKGEEPLTSGKAFDAMEDLFHGAEGQAAMLAAIGKHLTIAGECYAIGRNVPMLDKFGQPTGPNVDTWEILSCLEVKVAGDSWSITPTEEGLADIPLTEQDAVIRIWRPHPERRGEADSPFRSLLPILTEIEWLTLHIFAQCSSRLTGAGLMFITQGIEFPPPIDEDGKPKVFQNQAEGLMMSIADAMMASIKDPGNPAAYVPGIASVPQDVMEKSGKIAELMHFWTDLDEKALEMRNAAVHRFALGMDLDPQKVEGISTGASTGGGNSQGPNHWGMWQVQEETITIHIEPMLDLVCAAFSVYFLQPATDGTEVVRYDTARLRLRPDRSKESIELFNLGLLKPEVPVRENGFDPENDMLDAEERKLFLLFKIAGGSATPEMVYSALKELGVELEPLSEMHYPHNDIADRPPLRESRPPPSLEDHPTKDLPERASLLLHATEPLVLHALQRIGNRLRSGVDKKPTCPAYEVHTLIQANGSTASLMADAFPSAALTLEGVADPQKVVPVLESYCENLLTEQKPHSRNDLEKWLKAASL